MANNSSTSGITIRDNSSEGTTATATKAKSAASSAGANVNAQDFEARAGMFALSAKQCEDLNKDQIAAKGSAFIRMRPVCADADGEMLEITIGCDDLAGEISISPSFEEDTIESQCEGKMRKRYNGAMVEISIEIYLDRLMNNPALLKAIHYGNAIAETNVGGKTYEAYGIGKELFRRELPRYYVEVVPQESDGVAGIIFWPYAALGAAEINASFGKSAVRKATIKLTASMPEYDESDGGMPPVVSGIWRQK
jgi:hypothetical protein